MGKDTHSGDTSFSQSFSLLTWLEGGFVHIFRGEVTWGLFVLSLGLFIATYYLFPDKMPGLKGNYLSTRREVLKAAIVGIILLIVTLTIGEIVPIEVFHWPLRGH